MSGAALTARRLFDPAIARLERAVALSNRGAFVHGTLGWALAEAGRAADANTVLEALRARTAPAATALRVRELSESFNHRRNSRESDLVHVITDQRRFAPPVPVPEAVEIARNWTGRSNVECLANDEKAAARTFDLIDRHSLGRSRLADTMLVATMLAHGVTVLATRNTSDFAPFSQLRLIDPIAS